SRCDDAALVLICDSAATVASFAHLRDQHPTLTIAAAITNPQPITAATDAYAGTPERCGWDDPAAWRRYDLTDRWARIDFALALAETLGGAGYLLMPAHDAVWGRGLLARLIAESERHAANGMPAAVSPYSPLHHSPVPGVDIDPAVIDAINAAWARDSRLRQRLNEGRYQAFWGKTGMLPLGMCGDVRRRVET